MKIYLKKLLLAACAVVGIMPFAPVKASESPSLVRRKLDFGSPDEETTDLSATVAACSLAKEAPAVSTPKKAPAVSPFFAGTRYEEAAKKEQYRKYFKRDAKLEHQRIRRESEPLSDND